MPDYRVSAHSLIRSANLVRIERHTQLRFPKTDMIRIYVDTSVINWLCDDRNCLRIVDRIQTNSPVFISIYTVAELAATSCAERRMELLLLARHISGGIRPLAMPGDILKRSLDALIQNQNEMDASMDDEWDGLWYALQDPSLVDDQALAEVFEWKKNEEKWYHEMHDQGRPILQEVIRAMEPAEQQIVSRRFGEFLRQWSKKQDLLADFVCETINHGDGPPITVEVATSALDLLDSWRFYLAAFGYGIFVRSIQAQYYQKRRNPGSIDTQQAVYLSTCQIFVTADVAQRKMLRRILPVGRNRPKIMSYVEFVTWLGF